MSLDIEHWGLEVPHHQRTDEATRVSDKPPRIYQNSWYVILIQIVIQNVILQ